jgi:ABC-2 type transport system ATP-binding protein
MLKAGRVVALDTTANLLAGLSGIHLKVRLEPDRLPEALRARATPGTGGLQVIALDHASDVADAIAALRAEGTRVLDVQLEQPDLEEVFLRLVGREELAP